MIRIDNLSKAFTLHNQGGAVIPVMVGATLTVLPGECAGLTGPSGAGKSTLMRMVYWAMSASSCASCPACLRLTWWPSLCLPSGPTRPRPAIGRQACFGG